MGEGRRKQAAPPEQPPHVVIAERVYTQNVTDDEPAWVDLAADDRDGFCDYAADVIGAHVQLLVEQGYKIIPPGAAPIPKSQEEALAMVQAAKAFFDGQKRQGKLLNTAVDPRLINPTGGKH